MDSNEPPCRSPYPLHSSLLLKDITNFKTPKRPLQNQNFTSSTPQFFTATKQSPLTSSSCYSSSFHHHHRHNHHRSQHSKAKTATARRLRAFELEQSQSSRKAQIKKEQSLKSLAKSLSTWLNFLFQNPNSCGCNVTVNENRNSEATSVSLGKRDGGPGGAAVDASWRCPKRHRDLTWRSGGDKDGVDVEDGLLSSSKRYGALRESLKEVCSLDDLKERMRVYLSLSACKEILDVMSPVVKNIDEGRLKMKSHCPMVTDVGMKEKAIQILMCYNPIWLRIGLHIIFGGDSLLPDGDVNSDQEIAFLKMVIEKQFFTHAGLAKAYAYNKMVDGLYRPGYYETLGNVILKRSLLLVLILDRAKSQTVLPLKYGIDGVDGGSPLLFTVQSSIKSSRQVINDFLSLEVMHGEGNLLAHLLIVGYKVSYQQCPIVEYDFTVTDIFVDLQDGVRLCRAIQLLQNDSSILTKMLVPSDTRKKSLANCGIALQYLKNAGVTLCDDDGMTITEADVACGDKELTISLFWNIFVHLQLPLLINKTILADEILKIFGTDENSSNAISPSSSSLELLWNWIQVVCGKYDYKINNFSSLVDGKAIWCLLDYYFRKELCCSHSKDPKGSAGEESIMSAADYTDAVHNFLLSQKLISLLGNFPEVLQISDILEHSGAISDRTVVILLVFLASQLIMKKNMDQLNFHKLLGCNCQSPERRHLNTQRCPEISNAVLDQEETDGHNTEDAARKFKAIKAWWQDMAERNSKFITNSPNSAVQQKSTGKSNNDIKRRQWSGSIGRHDVSTPDPVNAAIVVQKYIRSWMARSRYKASQMEKASFVNQVSDFSNIETESATAIQFFGEKPISTMSQHNEHLAATKIQSHFRGWLLRRKFLKQKRAIIKVQSDFRCVRCWRSFQQLRIASRSAIIIQSHVRGFIARRRAHRYQYLIGVLQKCIRGWLARARYKVARMEKASFVCELNDFSNLEIESAVAIPSSWEDSISSGSLHNQQLAAAKIQSRLRGWLLRKTISNQKKAITKIQSNFRCLRFRRAFQQLRISTRSAIIIQSHVRGWISWRRVWRHMYLIGVLQRCCRGWLIRRDFLFKREAVTKIQNAIRCFICWKAFQCHKHAAIEIQRFVRGQITRSRLLGASHFRAATTSYCNFHTSRGYFQSLELRIILSSVLKLQRWWKGVLLLKLKTKLAIIIQSHVRGWIGRRRASEERQRVVVIQSYWKGYVARKESREQLVDLRLRVQKLAKNVDDSLRIINRLKLSLSELENVKSISGILHTCSTLDMATEHSQKCCEELVAAGAIEKLLKLIRSVSRSIPDQEVLKHALSTLCNLAHYPHLIEAIIDSHGSVETILWELLRNKEEGYFIASELLKRICSNQKGVVVACKSPALLKRLRSLVEELTRKANTEKKNPRAMVAREITERRLREAVELLKLTSATSRA